MKREEYEERMKNKEYRELAVTNCDSGKDYVFISYRGNSWKTVLTKIVHKLQKQYKLRIYFDKEFASETNIWIEQFIKNMDSRHCKACLCFFDEGYVTSYATLLELMHAMNPRSKLGDSIFPISFPIDWAKLDSDDWNTGLGMMDPDNPGWEEEIRTFEREFRMIKKKYPAVEDYYYEGAELRACDCKDIMAIIQPKNKRDYVDEEAFYKQFIVDPLEKKCPEVFEREEITEYQVIIVNNEKKTTFQIKEGDVVPKQDSGVRDGFEFEGWFVSNTDEEWDFANEVHGDIEIYAKWEDVSELETSLAEGYKYTIFGEAYKAGSREQGKLMFDAFEALINRHPECVEKLTQRTSIAKAEDVINANSKDAEPTYFRGCKSFNVDGNEYLVGTSYGYKAKISEIKGMFKICGEDPSEFVLNGESLGAGKGGSESSDKRALWEYSSKGARSKLIWNGKTSGTDAIITVLRGSVTAMPSQNFEKSCNSAFKLKKELEAKDIIKNGKFMQDYTYNKVSTMINLLNGGSVSTPAEVRCGHLRKIDGQELDGVNESDNGSRSVNDIVDAESDTGIFVDYSENVKMNGFEYILWGIPHTANKMSDVMHDVFDLIAEKYPDKIAEIVSNDNISSVARKEDVDGCKLPSSKLNYFRSSREHNVGDRVYYVGTSYNRTQGIGQLERMLKICEGSAEGFKITSSPERISHSSGKTGKKGIGELL